MDMHLTSPLLPKACLPRLMSTLGLPWWPWESKLRASILPVSFRAMSMLLQACGEACRALTSEQDGSPTTSVILPHLRVLSTRPEEMWVSRSHLHSLCTLPLISHSAEVHTTDSYPGIAVLSWRVL